MSSILFQGIQPIQRRFEVIYGPEYGADWVNRIQIWVFTSNVAGEFSIRWYTLYKHTCARLEVFSDAWYVLTAYCADLLQLLAKLDSLDVEPTIEQIVEDLLNLGFEQKE